MAPESEAHDEVPGQAMPEGIGLSFDQVRTLLIQAHKTTMSDDDPMLMLVTINNAFLGEYDKLLDRHNEALTAFLVDQAHEYLEVARVAAEAASGVGVIQETCRKHSAAVNVCQGNMKWLAAITAISALLNVAVFVGGALR